MSTTESTIRRRPIDIHENAIVLFVELCDDDGLDAGIAAYRVAKAFGLTEERLVQLARTWCALAGVKAPA